MDLLQSDCPTKTILVPKHIEIRELAELLQLKPFKVVADLMELKRFNRPDDLVDFETASTVVKKHGYTPGRIM